MSTDATTAVARIIGRRATRSGAAWGAVFGLYVVSNVSGYATTFPTVASRLKFARSLGPNAGLRALLGPARHIETVAGYTAWRGLGVLSVVGAAWALLAGTRLLRGEEDAGRWELLLAGQTTRRQATGQGLAGLAAGWAALWTVTAVVTVAEGYAAHPRISPSAALFFSLAVASTAAIFLAVGAFASQLAPTRRQAAALAGGAFGVAFMIRMVADTGSQSHWAIWASPLGWVEELHPLTGSRPIMLVPIAAFVALLSALTVHLAGARDAGASILPDRDSAPSRTRLLTGPGGLAVRLVRPIAIAWVAAIAACGLLFGLVAQSAADAVSGSATVERALARIGGTHGGASAYLGLTFLVIATLVALVAAGQVAGNREEESQGRLDNLLVRPVSRSSWLAKRLATACGVLLAAGLAAGVLAWVGAASQHSGVSFARLVEAGLNTVPPAAFVLGLGTAVHATVPRAAVAASYGIVAWSFLVELLGSVVKASRVLLDTSVLYHVAPAPAADPHWSSAAVLIALGVVTSIIGAVAFAHRDLMNA